MSSRVFIVSLFFMAMPVVVNGQSVASDFYTSTLNVHYTERIVETEATVLAKEKQYLDDTVVQGDPTVLVPGDLWLTIDGHPFTLYIQPERTHTEVRLESRQLEISSELKRKADAHLKLLGERIENP